MALRDGWRGAVGILAIPLVGYLILNAVLAEGGLIQLVKNTKTETHMARVVAEKTARLDEINLRIDLIKNYSPDYIEELIQRHLNMAAPGVRILR